MGKTVKRLEFLNLILLIVGITLVVIGNKVVEGLASEIINAIGYICLGGFCGSCWGIIDIMDNSCNHCKELLKGCSYEYKVLKTKPIFSGMEYKVEMIVHCPICGGINTKKGTFYVKKGQNIQDKVEKYCYKKFG